MKSWGHWPWKPLVLPTYLPPGQELTQEGQQKRWQKWRRWSFHQAPWWQIHQKVCGDRAAVNKLLSWGLLFAHSSPDHEPGRETSCQNSVLTDFRSILQSLQSPEGDQIFSNIRQELSLLKNKTSVTLQCIPSHCGVGGNEEADRLSKMGSKLEQSAQPMSYSEAKTILRNNFRTDWRQRLVIGTEEDSIHQLDRAAHVTIFRLRTGHCQLLSHLHRLKISHSDECPCGTGPQTPNHILQSCTTLDALRCQTWPSPVDAHRKLLRPVETLRQTADFSLLTVLKI